MILIDFSQVILASLFVHLQTDGSFAAEEDFLRHTFLSSIRHNRLKFREEYGEIVICCDSKLSWRRDFFPYYKANRKKSREESNLDWQKIFEIIEMIKQEMIDYMPYKVLEIDKCEADDIIGTLVHKYGVEHPFENHEKILILSGDKDYVQLQKYWNVSQYNPVRKEYVGKNMSPEEFLKDHVIRGDTGDGVPNVLSEDNCLVIGKRQTPVTKKRLEVLLKRENLDEITLDRLERNARLIDLSRVPDEFKTQILDEYEKPKETKDSIFNYFIQKKLKLMMQHIGDFKI